MRKKRAVFAVLASLAASLFILFGCGASLTSNKANADVPLRFKLISGQYAPQTVDNIDDNTCFYIYEDTQTHIEYIVANVNGRGVSMTPFLGPSGGVMKGP